MAKIFDPIEIGLSEAELRQALRAWMQSKTSIFDYRVTDVTLHPRAEYVVRFKVEPPLDKADKEAIAKPETEPVEPNNV